MSCRLIGQRFGYGVLGKFFAIRDESERLRQLGDMPPEAAEQLARESMAEAEGQVVEDWRGHGDCAQDEDGDGTPAMPRADNEFIGMTSAAAVNRAAAEGAHRAEGMASAAAVDCAADPAEDEHQAEGLDSAEVQQRGRVHGHEPGVAAAAEAAVVEAASVSFADVLADLDAGAEDVREPVAEAPSSTSSGCPTESGRRQTDLSHWLK